MVFSFSRAGSGGHLRQKAHRLRKTFSARVSVDTWQGRLQSLTTLLTHDPRKHYQCTFVIRKAKRERRIIAPVRSSPRNENMVIAVPNDRVSLRLCRPPSAAEPHAFESQPAAGPHGRSFSSSTRARLTRRHALGPIRIWCDTDPEALGSLGEVRPKIVSKIRSSALNSGFKAIALAPQLVLPAVNAYGEAKRNPYASTLPIVAPNMTTQYNAYGSRPGGIAAPDNAARV